MSPEENETMKQDLTELFNLTKKVKRKYGRDFKRLNQSLSEVDTDLRDLLKLLRTDEENQQQSKTDRQC